MALDFTFVWGILALAFGATEVYALLSYQKLKAEGSRGDRGTFSWHIWWLRKRWWGRLLALWAWGWPFYHFFFEPHSVLAPVWGDDYFVLAGLAILSIFIRPRGS